METLFFGKYSQGNFGGSEPIEWLILNQSDEEMLLLSKYALDRVRYVNLNDTEKWLYDFEELSHTSWRDSYLRGFLNTTFLRIAFDQNELEQILLTERNCELRDRHGELIDIDVTSDKVFCLDNNEMYYLDEEYVKALPTRYALGKLLEDVQPDFCNWWRHYDGRCHGPFLVSEDGGCCTDCLSYNDCCYIRPAIRIKKNRNNNENAERNNNDITERVCINKFRYRSGGGFITMQQIFGPQYISYVEVDRDSCTIANCKESIDFRGNHGAKEVIKSKSVPKRAIEEFFTELERTNWEERLFVNTIGPDCPMWYVDIEYSNGKIISVEGSGGDGPNNMRRIYDKFGNILTQSGYSDSNWLFWIRR